MARTARVSGDTGDSVVTSDQVCHVIEGRLTLSCVCVLQLTARGQRVWITSRASSTGNTSGSQPPRRLRTGGYMVARAQTYTPPYLEQIIVCVC